MDFKELQSRALGIFRRYGQLNRKKGLKVWERQDLVSGFVGDVGALMKYTMAADGLRHIDGHADKLEHELADCLWSLLVISKKYDVDLEAAFLKVMDEQINKGLG